jgi:sulfite reductase (NADPH) flavoprotein alpha-component
MAASSRTALEAAEQANAEAGHELGGFVSAERGFLPKRAPASSLPDSHGAWDEVAASLPALYRAVRVREALRTMPILPADPVSLPDEHLLRAVTLLSMFAHAWVRVEMTDGGDIPPPVLEPWTQVTQRMGRAEPFMQYNDLILTNWRMKDPSAAEPFAIENLDLMLPTVGNQTEHVFYLTQVEMTAKATPLLTSVVRAQEAMAVDDIPGVRDELVLMLEVLRSLVERSFVKIDPNPLAATHCDPVIWGTTVAPFAVSLKEHIAGPGGTANPVFHLVDAFLGRTQYGSQLGDEASRLRVLAPPLQQDFVRAVNDVSLRDFLARMRSRSLDGLVQTVADAFSGEQGIIAAHRLKAYGFLEVAFKVGRTVTIGGFKGLFRDRPWKEVDKELNITRMERAEGYRPHIHRGVLGARGEPAPGVARVSFDVAERGVVYHPGDRCGVLVENAPDLVARTLEALDADGSEVVPLTPNWVTALASREGYEGSTKLALADFLRFAKLRPVLRPVAKALYAATVSPRLGEILETRTEDQWELWDLLKLLVEDGYDVSRLVSAESWQAEALAHVVPPEPYRMYSVSSAPDAGPDGLPATLDLTVGALVYESNGVERQGTASSFLTGGATEAAEVPVRVAHPRRFRLPDDPTTPIVMFAAGTGIAPFRGFMHSHPGAQYLYVGARVESMLLYRDELAANERLNLRAAFADEGGQLEREMEDHADELRELASSGVFYLCGRPGFAQSVMETLAGIVGRQALRQMVADRRLMMDIFTAFAPAADAAAGVSFEASDVVLHNDDEHGYWLVVDGMVYDMSEFVNLHPGGKKIIVESAGMDASREYRAVLHHENSEIEAMLSMYKIGPVRRLRFGGEWGVFLTPDGFEYLSLHDAYRFWVRYLYLVVEMQNALNNDFSYMRMVTVRGEEPDAVTPYKMMLFGNTHLRFFDHYFHGSLGDDLRELWAVTTGLCAPDQPLRALGDGLDAVAGSAAAGVVDRFGERLRGVYRAEAFDEAAMRALVEAVQAADGEYLRAMKMTLRDGVRVFEKYESETLRLGGQELVDVLLRAPGVAAAYYDDLIARVGAVAPTLLD